MLHTLEKKTRVVSAQYLNPHTTILGCLMTRLLQVVNTGVFPSAIIHPLWCEHSTTNSVCYISVAMSSLTTSTFIVPIRRLAKSLPLPVENEESRPRIDLVVFIINLTSELR